MRKYGNKKITVDGVTFDSKKEFARFWDLSMLERAGEISELRRQVPFVLIPAQYEEYERYSKKTGKSLKDGRRMLERECTYLADFVYIQNGERVVEDTKGVRTKDYIIKRKLMLHVHGIKIHEI